MAQPIMLALEKHHILIFKEHATWPLASIALIVISVFAAWISYHVIEVPGQRLRALLKVKRPTAPAALRRTGELNARRGTDLRRLPALHDEDGTAVDLSALAEGRPLIAFLHPGEYDHDRPQDSQAASRKPARSGTAPSSSRRSGSRSSA